MPYPINQRAHQFNSIQSVPVSFGLWDTALKFLSPGPRNDVTDYLEVIAVEFLDAVRNEEREIQQSFIRWSHSLLVQHLTLLYNIFDRKGAPFVYLQLKDGTPFTYLLKNTVSLLSAVTGRSLTLNKSRIKLVFLLPPQP